MDDRVAALGALAVKNYGWYQVIHWRGYVNAAGSCFDVFDSTQDQHYDPSRPTYASMAAAVDATWATLAHKQGQIFATYYNAGQPNEACGAGANGWQMFQWGTQACGLDGRSAAQIMGIYYPGVTISAAPPPAAGAGHARARADPDARRPDASARPGAERRRRPPRPHRRRHPRRRRHRLRGSAGRASRRRPGRPHRAAAAAATGSRADRRQHQRGGRREHRGHGGRRATPRRGPRRPRRDG